MNLSFHQFRYFGTALEVEGENEFAFTCLTLTDKKDSVTASALLKD